VEGDSGLTQSGAIIGTPSYMAPEQARAEKGLTTSVDVYALGAILYELLTGQPPFRAPIILDTILQVLEKEPTDPRTINLKADRDLSLIALKCLEKVPGKRYESAAALADDLHHWLKGEPISVRPMRRSERFLKWVRRHPSIAALTTALMLVCIVGFFTVFSLWRLAEERRGKAEVSADDANDQKRIAQQERDLANELRRQSLFEQVRSERATGDRWHSLALAKEVAGMKITPELRQEAIQTATSSGFRQVCKLGPRHLGLGGEGPFFAFHRDGTMIATAEALQKNNDPESRMANGIRVWQIPSGQLLGEEECDYYEGGFAFSPTEPILALTGQERVRLWEPKSGKETVLFQGTRPVRFSSDGSLLAASGKDGCIVWDMRKNKQIPLQLPGRLLAFVAPEKVLVRMGQRLSVWDVRSGKETFKSPEGWSAISATYYWSKVARSDALVIMRRGQTETGFEAGDVEIWNCDSGKKIVGFPKLGRATFSESFPISSNAGVLAVQDPTDPTSIQLLDLTTGQLRRRLTSPSPSKGVLSFGWFNSDGTMLAAQEIGETPTVRLWNVESGEFYTTLHDRENPVWSADGRHIAVFGPGKFVFPDGSGSSGNRNAVIVYEIATGAPTYRLSSTLQAFTFSKDGHRFAAHESTWDVVERSGGVRLTPSEVSTSVPAGLFHASGNRLWMRGHTGVEIPPSERAKLWQVFPEKREIVLASVKRSEPGYIQHFAVSPDGGLALVEWVRRVSGKGNSYSMEGQLEFWNLATGKRLSILNSKSEFGLYQDWPILQFSPDGKLMFIKETNGNLEIWDSGTRRKLREVQVQTDIKPGQYARHIIRNALFSANGEALFTCSETGRVDKIDVSTGKSLAAWKVPDEEPRVLALHPTESILAVGGSERMIYLLDATDSGRELARWQGHDVSIAALTFSPDGRTLVSGSRDGVIKLWDLPRIRSELKAVNLDW
jgi:WD40 repeat protein